MLKNIILLIVPVFVQHVFGDLHNQPRIISSEGDLVFQSAEDKNITIRLAGSSRFMINDVNVLSALQKASIPRSPGEEIEIASLPIQVQNLKTDVRRLTNRLRRVENRTTSLPNGRIRRLQSRVQALVRRVNEIATKLKVDDCTPNPCKNGGMCYDLYENFHCECPDTWTGKTCESDVDECYSLTGTDLGCQNNAACVNLPGSYRCVCTNGFTGTHCRDRGTDCSKSRPGELCANGVCIPANNEQGYQCICDVGWKLDNVTQSCTVDVNECLESLVACHTSCINLPGSFMCGPCPNGYTGSGVTCRDIDECATNNGGCSALPKVQCINTEGSYRCGNCPPGWTGDGRYCSQVDTNACADNNICHPLARCEYISNTIVCVCPTGMTGSGYGPDGCRAGSANPCNEHQCQNGGTCINYGTTYTCICPSGFDPPFCQSQNPCAQRPCLNGGTCVKQDNSNDFRCVCPRDATGRLCQNKRNSCGSVIRDQTGELTHPPEGGEYMANEACAWVIRTEENLILNVSFSRFDVQPDPECSKDWLQINDGRSLATPLIGRFCGNQLPHDGNILTSQNTIFLWFRTDNSTNSAGFSLNWNSVPPICGGRQVVDGQGHGVIKSPGYPGKSPPNRDCEWVIEAPFGKRVLLRFYEVVMDRSANCTKDSLIIYDTNEPLEHVCETGVPAPKYTSSNVAKIHFHTDPYREDSLFQVHFEVVEGKPGCGGLFTEPEGKMLFTSDLTNCVFLIQQPPGTRIYIAFTKGEPSLGLISIKIFDGKTEDDPILEESYDDSLPSNLTSSANFMLIVISVRNAFLPSFKAVLFEANYKLVCGQELVEPLGGTFMTPNYPKPYYAGLNCAYTIVGPLNSVVHLNITDYDISEYTEACDDDSDFIEFYYTISGSAERHCKDVPMHIVASSNYLRISFQSNTNPQRRRGISAGYYFEQMGCGGVLRDTEGSFELLDVISGNHAFCKWILEAPETYVISLDLLYKRTGRKCTADEVDLRIFINGTEPEGRLVESHCGGEKRILTILPSNLATIFMKLIPPTLHGSDFLYAIRANYKFTPRSSSCGGNYTLLSGSIQSPGWPKEYFDSSDCVWVIHAPLGHKIELVPRNFSLEPSARQCDDDYLEIRNGLSDKSPLIGKYCGDVIPPHIPSFTNHLYLHFHSDSTFAYPGFDIPFQQTSTGCGGSLSSHSGSIASPHYPEISRGPVQCDWKITVSQGSSIDIRITKLSPSADLCSNDVLIIYDGDDSLAKRLPVNCSSTETLITLTSSKNVIYVRYALPEIGAADDQQFYLSYKTNCRQTLNSMQGVIESPNFPDDYPNYLRCEWNIVGRKADTISLTFSHFDLETFDQQCLYDVFEVIDMKGDESLQTHKICRNPAEVLTSDGNRFVIKFTTDFSNVANGFRLEFKRNGCGGYLTRSSGLFASPNPPYSVDVECEWLIETTPGMQIILDVFDVHIESESDNCSINGLVVKNDKSDIRDLLRECKTQQMPMTVTSHGSTMFVRFYSDTLRSRKYFKASYRTKEGQCGGVYRGNQGEIMSPNYPQNYSEKSYCEWMISVEGSSTLEFNFDALDLPTSNNCSKGFVEVYDGIKTDENSKLIDRYCSTGLRMPKQTSTNRINVVFSSEDGPPAKGFVMSYRKTCGGIMTESTGFIKSNVQDGVCIWQIQAKDEGSKITINFMHIDCHCEGLTDTECHKTRGVKVAASVTSPPILSFCQNHPPDFISDGQYLAIAAANVTFTAKYSTVETACGGILTSLRGSLTSPYYPQTYPSNVECVWTIQASLGNYLELNFVEMDIAKSDDCNEDYLEVREKTSNGKLLGVFCSNILPTESIQVFEQFWIKFRSSENGVGKGFKLSWTYAQLNEITGFNGQIQPPPITSLRSEPNPFQWRITVPRDNFIWLAFKEYNRGLKLYDGFDINALPIEIQLSPSEVTSSTSVIFLTSDNQLLDHFRIEWKALSKDMITKNKTLQDCNETLIIGYGPVVNLSSPGYPSGYEHNLHCQWLVKSDHPTRHAVVELYEARLEKTDNCFADSLKIASSQNLVDWHEDLKVCDSPPKSRTPIAEIHGTPYLKLNLDTDGSVNRTGFTSLLYTACGGNLTGSIGRILDVDVYNTTNEALVRNCTWHIKVRAGRKIKFTFEFPRNTVKNSSDQCEIYALIRDGIDYGAPILRPGRICSYKEFNGTVISTRNYATVRYYMEQHNPFLPYEVKMWNLTYREYSDCGGEVRLTPYARSVNLSSPNYPNVPNPHTECVWRIVAPPGEAVQAEFVDHFDMNARYCAQEFIEFRDGSTELAPQLSKGCVKVGTIRSSGNVLYMRYLTDIAEPRNGFKVNVSLSTCGGTFTQYNNVITSSNYPAPGGYPANSVCDYVIKVSSYARINLTFIDVNLPFDVTNLNGSDHIKIYQLFQGDATQVEDEVAVIYGNTTTMPAMQVDSNELLIRLFSFKANNLYRGFKLKYERIFGVCFKDVSGESGVLTLSIAPKRLTMFVLCRWKITVPKGRRVKLDVLDAANGPTGVDASRNFKVTFYNDFQMLSRITMVDLSNITTNSSVYSTDNKMLIRIFGAYTTTLRRMQVAYSSSEVSNCPEDIRTDTGSLSVVGLDPALNFFCSSDFVLNGAQTLSFNISRLIVETGDQRLPAFAVRFKMEPFMESLRIMKGNTTNENVLMAVKHGSVSLLQNEFVKVRTFEATFTKHACGGEYRIGLKFDVGLPNLTLNYGSLDCAWHLSAAMNQNGYDLIANFSFTLPCENEFVVVYSGPSTAHLQVARLCQGVTLNATRLRSQYMYVMYHTTAYSPNSRLRMTFQRATNCGESLSIERSELLQFTSADYKNDLECIWELQASVGFYLRLEFTGRFYIEESEDCHKDYLELRKFENGTWVTLPRLCGRNLPEAINTTSERLQLIFRSDDSNTGDGFTVNILKTCYAVFNVTNQPQLITYPSRWSITTVRMHCDYILQTDSEKNIHVRFKKFLLGYRNRCPLTQLTAQKRSPNGDLVELGPYCKDNAVSELRAHKFISLSYDAIIETGGFEIEFVLDGCGGQVTRPMWIEGLKNEEGTGYTNNMNCVWNITAPEGHNIIIKFKYLIMERHEECSLDYVAIYRGALIQDDHREAKLCGNLTSNAPSFHIEGNSAVVMAMSDSSITKEGFSAHITFSKACDERLTLTQGNSPVEIERELEVGSNELMCCNYRVMGPPDFRIEVEVTEVDLNPQNATCRDECGECGYLEIQDSIKVGSLAMGRYCQLAKATPKVISSYKDVVIQANVEQQGRYRFKVKLRLVEADCDSQSEYILDDDSGVKIASRTHTNGLYPPNVHCTWKITSNRNFEIRFEHFSLQNKSDTTGQCLDYVHITYTTLYTTLNNAEHCGVISSFVINVETYNSEATAEITFHSNEAIESTGFSLTATNKASCNRIYNFTNGIIGGSFEKKIICLNDIILPENYTVNILIPTFYFGSSNCSDNYIRVYDKTTNRKIYEDCRARYYSRKIFTSTSQVRLDIMVTRETNAKLLYYGSHKSLPPGCGGNLEISDGYLSSPNYQEYGNSSVCRWNLTTTSPNRIELSFSEFNMGSVCRTDYLDIIEIASNGDEKVSRHFCERKMPQNYVSESNRIAIVSVAAADFDGTGWEMSFHIHPGGSRQPIKVDRFSDFIFGKRTLD